MWHCLKTYSGIFLPSIVIISWVTPLLAAFGYFFKSLTVLRLGFHFSSYNLLISGTKIALSLGIWQYGAI
jgi:hypothetical protein